MKNIQELQMMVEAEICAQHKAVEPHELYEPMWYALSNGGKRLRPVFMLMGCQLFSDDLKPALLPAVGIEMFHNFTLLHDDIMDKASMRRNLPTVHVKWDVNRAILSGDALAINANIYIARCDKSILPEVLDVFNTTALQVCEGQQYDLNFETLPDVSEEEYLNMIRLKTAVLIAGSLQIGSIIGGAESRWSSGIYELGCLIGMAFQLQDDYLDTFGNPVTFGKSIGGDILANKKTYLLIRARELANQEQLKILKKYFGIETFDPAEKIDRVKKVFIDLGVDKEIMDKVHDYSNKALAILDKLPVPTERKQELAKFTRNLMDRIR
ncbi:MAG: polyprenyl synthetase family protein [Bacteroidales bacterium]|nr:polyprenyl synthetase family protein [Bacteroidales bacterium]